MPKMTMAWVLFYVFAAGRSFVDPTWGVVGYMFEYYLRPSLHWWGVPLPDLRWNLTIAILLLISYLVARHNLPAFRPLSRNPAAPFLTGLFAVMVLVTPFAADVDRSYNRVVMFGKLLILYWLISKVVRTVKSFDTIIGMHMAGAAWWGWEAYQNPKREQSRLLAVGSSDTYNDNLAVAHLLTVLPFIFVYLLASKNTVLRGVALVAAPLVINVIVLCNSRGGMIGLAVAGLFAFFLAQRGHRLRLVGATVLMGLLFLQLADPEFIARQSTTQNFESEATAKQRFESWIGGWNLIKDNPFGTGGEGYEVLSRIYIPSIVEMHGGEARAPHNTYVLTLSEWGIQGFVLYVAFVGATFVMLQRVKRHALDQMVFYRAFALQIALIGTMTAATFSDRLYGESFYWMCGLAAGLYRMQGVMSEGAAAAAPVAKPVVRAWAPRYAANGVSS
jgi:O-antigen ligase